MGPRDEYHKFLYKVISVLISSNWFIKSFSCTEIRTKRFNQFKKIACEKFAKGKYSDKRRIKNEKLCQHLRWWFISKKKSQWFKVKNSKSQTKVKKVLESSVDQLKQGQEGIGVLCGSIKARSRRYWVLCGSI